MPGRDYCDRGMIHKSLLYLAGICMAFSCESITIARDSPDCIAQLIRTSAQKPIEINRYLYYGKTVYLVAYGCCDFYDSLYDDDCNYLCAPSGGITGKGDGICSDFHDHATNQKLIWKAE
jgi:hypothetical protein